MIKEIPVKAAQGKVIVRMITVPKKQFEKGKDIDINKEWALDKKMEISLMKRLYDDQPSQAIVISNGDLVQLRDGIEYNDLKFGDLVIIGTGNFDMLLWGGIEYTVIRTSMINGIIRRNEEGYPVYAERLFYDTIEAVESTIIN